MLIKPIICDFDQIIIESFFIDPFLIPCCQQDRFSLRIESKGDPPYSVICIKSEFLHVCMFGVSQRINMRPS